MVLQLARKICFACVPENTSLIFQPPRFGHTTLTTEGPSLILDWEASVIEDFERLASERSGFVSVLGIETQEYIWELSPKIQRKIVKNVPNDAGDLLRRKIERNDGALLKRKMGVMKNKRWTHLPKHQ